MDSYGDDVPRNKPQYKTGRWSPEEHEKFIEALKIHGKNWEYISFLLKTRSTTQVRSHAQKYFMKNSNHYQLDLNVNLDSEENRTQQQPTRKRSLSKRATVDILAHPLITFEVEESPLELMESSKQLKRRRNTAPLTEIHNPGNVPLPVLNEQTCSLLKRESTFSIIQSLGLDTPDCGTFLRRYGSSLVSLRSLCDVSPPEPVTRLEGNGVLKEADVLSHEFAYLLETIPSS